LGADLVVHSTTKYLNGHSDVIGGAVITKNAKLAADVDFIRNSAGPVPGPWDCWLTLRGLKTLAVRMDRHQSNATTLVEWLLQQPEVKTVYYPTHKSHPQYEIAMKQMSGFGGMIAIELDADLEQARKLCAATKIFTLAESLGGVESLIELPAAMTHASIPPDVREEIGITDGLVRVSVGIENIDDLIGDLEQALRVAGIRS
jgi:cystathionine gamma-lyase